MSFTHLFLSLEMCLSHLSGLHSWPSSLKQMLLSINLFPTFPSWQYELRLFYFFVNLVFVHVLCATIFSTTTRMGSVCSLLCPQHQPHKYFELLTNDCPELLVRVYSWHKSLWWPVEVMEGPSCQNPPVRTKFLLWLRSKLVSQAQGFCWLIFQIPAER